MAVSKNSLKGTLCVLAAGMCWGTTGTIQAFAPEGASSLTVGSARVVFSGIVLMLFMLAKRGRGLFAGGWSVRGVLLAAAGLAAYQLTFFTAVRMTGALYGALALLMRRENPELSLAALGELLDPPASKSAMYHRVLRLQELVDGASAAPGTEGGGRAATSDVPDGENNLTSTGEI